MPARNLEPKGGQSTLLNCFDWHSRRATPMDTPNLGRFSMAAATDGSNWAWICPLCAAGGLLCSYHVEQLYIPVYTMNASAEGPQQHAIVLFTLSVARFWIRCLIVDKPRTPIRYHKYYEGFDFSPLSFSRRILSCSRLGGVAGHHGSCLLTAGPLRLP